MTLAESLQKFHDGMFGSVLGIKFVDAAPDRIVAELTVREDLCTTPGILHGGAIMGFADALGGTATALNLPDGAGTTTIESKTNFFAPGRTGETIRGECVPAPRQAHDGVADARHQPRWPSARPHHPDPDRARRPEV